MVGEYYITLNWNKLSAYEMYVIGGGNIISGYMSIVLSFSELRANNE